MRSPAALRQYGETVFTTAVAWARRARGAQVAITVIGSFGGAALAALGGAMEGAMWAAGPTTKGLAVGIGVAFVFFAGVLLLIIQDEAPALLLHAR